MVCIKQDFTAAFQTTKDGDIETTEFHVGDEVTLLQTWEHFYLIKDQNGHLYNIRKTYLEVP